ncbi:DNA polymerase III subunit alpha [bacterium (Candidatus Torokbacteria) CG09_land_8_20_14_0_10_42_11]|nr:MAG: DNA polymerase III subunit alpha [bacterium (Candidatus Torokbacteria) CG09_land_8_20_14_0_10_42_11]
MFIHLHNHSHYSLLDGLSKIDALLSAAASYKMPSLALTDHGVMYGAIEFYEKARALEIKPLIGVEVYIAKERMEDKRPNIDNKSAHLVLLAKNKTGYQNLIQLTTQAHLAGFYYKPRIDRHLLSKHKDGLIALSACLKGEIPAAIVNRDFDQALKITREYQKIFGPDNFYLELQHHPNIPAQAVANAGIIKIARENHLPLVATNDTHYLESSDAEAQEILLCLQSKNTLLDQNRSLSMIGEDFSFKSPQVMEEDFRDTPDAIANTEKIAAMCDLKIPLGKIKLPDYPMPGNASPLAYLKELCFAGFNKRYRKSYANSSRILRERLDYELSIIEKTGFASYLLIVQDFVNWAKEQNIVVGPGRGSAAGSLVAYLLNITDVDPIQYDLLFERFLNPERISMPDIDLDFADTRRDEVIDYVRQKYGQDHVAQIITFGTMASRAAIRDVGRVLGYPYSFCDQIAKMIPMFFSLDKSLKNVPELKNAYQQDEKVKRLIEIARKLEGVARHASTHACGILITKEPIDEVAPRQYASASDKTIVSQYEMHAIESTGLLKMDFLGLKNLTILENTLKIIEKIRGEKIDLKKIPLNDPKTFALLASAKTTGVFQLESSGMRRYLKELKPTEFENIIAMVALYRPGPIEWIPDYIAGKNQQKIVTYLHPKLRPILEKTYGVAVYQEQVLQIARDLAGFSLGEADILRKAVGKKIPKLLAEQKEKFIQGCLKNGLKPGLASKIFSFIEPFAGYGFNRAHAACYALIGYQTAYLKARYPAEFMAALLTSDQSNMDRIAIEVAECKNLGIKVLAPDINESFANFTVIKQKNKKEVIRFGLSAVKNVGGNIVKQIISARKQNGPFLNLDDFVKRVQDKDLNKKSFESLAKCGALDKLGERNQMLQNTDRILRWGREQRRIASAGQRDLFASLPASQATLSSLRLEQAEIAQKEEQLKWEKDLLGLYISHHPLEDYRQYLAYKTTAVRDLNIEQKNDLVTLGGIINTVKKIITRKGDPMLFVAMEDLTDKIEILVFPRLLLETPALWQENKIILVSGKISDKDGEPKLLAESASPVTIEMLKQFQEKTQSQKIEPNSVFVGNSPPVQIELPGGADRAMLMKLKSFLSGRPGSSSVFLQIPDHNPFARKKIKTEFKVNFDDHFSQNLREFLGAENIKINQI